MRERATRGLAVAMVACAGLAGGCEPPKAQFAPPPPPKVTVAEPVRMMVPQVVEATGTTRGVETVEIRARVRGFVAQKLKRGGERVAQGELILTIDDREYQARVLQAEAELASRQAALALAQITLERGQRAREGGAATDLEVKQFMAARDQAGAAVELAEAQLMTARLDLEFTRVTSPIAGRLSLDLPDQGQLVGAGEATLLARVVNEEKILVRYSISERELLQLRRQFENRRPGEDGRPNDVVVRMQLAGEQGFPHVGRYRMGDNTVDPMTGTINLDAEFDNATGSILAGLFARIESTVAEREVITVPDVAVQQDQQGRFVLVMNEAKEVNRRDVTVGRVVDRRRAIESGLKGDELVVISGLQRARAGGTKVEPVREGAGESDAGTR
jgi:RND family efflux transporter MFP subunit